MVTVQAIFLKEHNTSLHLVAPANFVGICPFGKMIFRNLSYIIWFNYEKTDILKLPLTISDYHSINPIKNPMKKNGKFLISNEYTQKFASGHRYLCTKINILLLFIIAPVNYYGFSIFILLAIY